MKFTPSTINDESPVVICDGYVPISIQWNTATSAMPRYCVLGNGKTSLLEIRVDGQTGAVYNIAAVLLPSIRHFAEMPTKQVVETRHGVPCCDVSLWNGKTRIDEQCDIEAFYGIGKVVILFGGSRGCSAIRLTDYISGNVVIRLTSNRVLREIEVKSLTPTEVRAFCK